MAKINLIQISENPAPEMTKKICKPIAPSISKQLKFIITYLDIVNKGSLNFVTEPFPLDKNILFMAQQVYFFKILNQLNLYQFIIK